MTYTHTLGTQEGYEGAGDTWCLFMRLLQHVWNTREIPRQMLLSVVVLIPKGVNDYRDIGLLWRWPGMF